MFKKKQNQPLFKTVTVLIEIEKAFDKIPHPFMLKTLRKLVVEEPLQKIYINIILTSDTIKVFPLRSRTGQECFHPFCSALC